MLFRTFPSWGFLIKEKNNPGFPYSPVYLSYILIPDFQEIQRDTRRAKRAVEEIGFWGSYFLGNTKEIQREYAAREARRGKSGFGGRFF